MAINAVLTVDQPAAQAPAQVRRFQPMPNPVTRWRRTCFGTLAAGFGTAAAMIHRRMLPKKFIQLPGSNSRVTGGRGCRDFGQVATVWPLIGRPGKMDVEARGS